MKKKFEVPACEVIRFTWKDIICTSGDYTFDVEKNTEHSDAKGSASYTDADYDGATN